MTDKKNKIKKPKISTWKPKSESEEFVKRDGKLFVCKFDKIFNMDKLSSYNIFIFNKDSYINQLDTIVRYINYFINKYDLDQEIPTAYLQIKFLLDKEKAFDGSSIDGYIDLVYNLLFTPTVVEKILRMTEDNYLEDIESGNKNKKYLKSEKRHLESLEFTNQHVKLLLAISFSIKLLSPCMFHYVVLTQTDIGKRTDTIYRFYKRLFSIFSFGTDFYNIVNKNGIIVESNIPKEVIMEKVKDENLIPVREDYATVYYYEDFTSGKKEKLKIQPVQINIYNKLYVYVKAKVLENSSSNQLIYAQREVYGYDIYSVIEDFTKRVLISENIVKFEYGANVIGFQKTIIKLQLSFFLKEVYEFNLTEITNIKNSDDLSPIDKLTMNQAKIDEGVVVLADLNIKLTTKRFEEMIDIELEDGELDYYKKNFAPCDNQILLVNSYLSEFYGNYRDLNLMNRADYVHILLLLKKKLLMDLGFLESKKGELRAATLPYILTANLSDKINNRIIRNTEYIDSVENDETYRYLIRHKYRYLEEIKPGFILGFISSFINTRYTFCTYEYPELLGEEISFPKEKVTSEILFFLLSI